MRHIELTGFSDGACNGHIERVAPAAGAAFRLPILGAPQPESLTEEWLCQRCGQRWQREPLPQKRSSRLRTAAGEIRRGRHIGRVAKSGAVARSGAGARSAGGRRSGIAASGLMFGFLGPHRTNAAVARCGSYRARTRPSITAIPGRKAAAQRQEKTGDASVGKPLSRRQRRSASQRGARATSSTGSGKCGECARLGSL